VRVVSGRDQRWTGTARVLLRTRKARRRRDAGAALRALAGDAARRGQNAVGLRIRGRRVLLLLDPLLVSELLARHSADTIKGPGLQRTRDMLGDGLLTSEGAVHDRARRLVAPAFSPGRLVGYVGIFARCTQDQMAGWTGGSRRDMQAELGALTLRIAGLTLLGIDLSTQASAVRADLAAALARFSAGGAEIWDDDADGHPDSARPDAARAARLPVHRLVDDIIEQRRTTSPADGADVVSALLAGSAAPGGLTAAEVHDHVITLLMAGHETTANALTWTLYLLDRHPEVQDRLRAEVGRLGGRAPEAGDLPTLTYARAVISEAIRLYPPAWIIGRTLCADLELGGWRLPAGSIAAVSPLLLHHDPRWYPDPETFDPGRWLDERRRAVPRHAYLPFGTGPRSCIGEQFAWTEAITVLVVLAQSWTFKADPGFEAIPSYRVTLRPDGELPMTAYRAGRVP
jgi:cytochrome P450